MDGTFKVGGASCSIVHTVDKMLPRLCLLACRSKWMLFLYVSLIEVFSGLRTMWYKPGWEVENKSSVNGMFFVTSPLLSLSASLPKLYIPCTINISRKLLSTAIWAVKKWAGFWQILKIIAIKILILNFQFNLECIFTQNTLKVKDITNNPWFKPWFNFLLQPQSIVDARR